MSTITTTQFDTDIATARTAMESLKRDKGQRPNAVRAFLAADTHEQREAAVEEWGAGFVRRGLHECAKFFQAHGQAENADVFWALRDDIDLDGDVFQVEES